MAEQKLCYRKADDSNRIRPEASADRATKGSQTMSKHSRPSRSHSPKAAGTDTQSIAGHAASKHGGTSVSNDEPQRRDAALDEALEESFPASDPVEIGHSEHTGRPGLTKRKLPRRP